MNRRKRMMADLDQDIRDYIEIETKENIARGMSPEEARYAALRKFGNVTRVREATHEVWSVTWMERLLQDLRYGARTLWKNPQFTIVAVLTLALGIGANTAIFSVVQGVVLAPLPFRQPDRLVMLWESRPNLKELGSSYPDFQDWQRNSHSFKQMAAFLWLEREIKGPGAPDHVDGMAVSSGFFSTLGVRPILGQDFSRSEDQPDSAPVAIISNHLWKERFASSTRVLGKILQVDGKDYTIIGVLPAGVRFWTNEDLYTPLAETATKLLFDRTVHGIDGIARLKPGISIGQAESELGSVQANLDRLYPTADRNLGIHINPLKREIVGDAPGTLFLLLGAVTMVLLIACANVANLLLARSAARSREFAIRTALGASRARVVRQLLTESTLLALTGGVLGVGLARVGLELMLAKLGSDLPRTQNVGMSLPVLLFAFGASLTVGILFGLAPALKSSRADVQSSLKAGGWGSTANLLRTHGGFVVVQMALTLVLLAGCGLLLRTMRDLWKVDPGFEAKHVITFKVGLSSSLTRTGASAQTAFQQLLDRIRHVPGVEAAGVTLRLPLSGRDNSGPFWLGTQAPVSMQDAPHAFYFWTDPNYLRTMKIPLLRGRFFTPADTMKSEPVIVINSVLAHKYFPGSDPVGQTMTVPHFGVARIVGVVGYVKNWGLNDPGTYNPSQIYLCVYQVPILNVPDLADYLTIVVRTPLDAATIMPAIKSVVYGAAANQAVYNVQTMEQEVSASMSSQRLPMLLLGAFAGLALLLASVGIYGTISYSVTQRVQEIGVRIALGASRWDVLRMILGKGIGLAVTGIIVGTAAAVLLGRVLSSFSQLLYGVKPSDPATLIAVSALLLGVAAAACFIPARRALKVDPVVALRYE
jgi:predicted permease